MAPSLASVQATVLAPRQRDRISQTRARRPLSDGYDPAAQSDTVLVIRAYGSTESVRATLVTEDFLKGILNYRTLSFESIYLVTFRFEKRQKAVLSGQMNRPYGNECAASP